MSEQHPARGILKGKLEHPSMLPEDRLYCMEMGIPTAYYQDIRERVRDQVIEELAVEADRLGSAVDAYAPEDAPDGLELYFYCEDQYYSGGYGRQVARWLRSRKDT